MESQCNLAGVQEHLELVHRLVKELAAVENTARDTATVCCGADDCKVSYAMQGRAYFVCIILYTCTSAMHVLDCV